MVGVHYIYFIFYHCTNLLINLCNLTAVNYPSQIKEKKLYLFLHILDTVFSAVDVFPLFHVLTPGLFVFVFFQKCLVESGVLHWFTDWSSV